MKRLLLLRHGKSDWNASYGSDHDRPLAARGQRAAALIGHFLQGADRIPQHVVTSSATRARTTVEFAATAGRWETTTEVTRALYLASVHELVERVQRCDDSVTTLLFAGHEPTWSEMISLTVGGGRFRFPTAAVASIRFDVDRWQTIGPGRGTLEWLVTPKMLASVPGRR